MKQSLYLLFALAAFSAVTAWVQVAQAQPDEAPGVLLAVEAVEDPVAEAAIDEPEPAEEDTATTGDSAEPDADPHAEEDTATTPDKEKTNPGTLRFHLMDGTIITGQLKTDSLPVKTEFGDLVVPVTAIHSFAPGLESHPKLNKKIQGLINQLGSPNAAKRDNAQAELITYGEELIPQLQRYADDADAERKVRVATIIEELYATKDDFISNDGPSISLVDLDTIVTEQFTVAGQIQQPVFNIESKFGKLVVNLEDIKAVERLTQEAPEVRRVVEVTGTDLAGTRYKNTGIKLKRGDRVLINAEGQITLTPWGNNSVSGPDGVPNNGMYNGKIPFGGLAGRVGDSGEEMLVGSKASFVAKSSGTLYLGFAMQQNWANYQFPGKYTARIRVVPAD